MTAFLARVLLPLLPLLAAGGHAGAPLPRFERVALPTGVTLRVVELGPADGEPVVFLHGYTDSLRSFAATMEHLAAQRDDLRLIALDLRGHGGSSLPDPERCASSPGDCFGVPALAADVLALMDAKEIERAHVVGHSLGSLIAQELALSAPARVGRIVLVGSAARTAGNPFGTEFLLAANLEGRWRDATLAAGLRFPEDVYARAPREVVPGVDAWLAGEWVVEPAADAAHLAAVREECARTPVGTWYGVLLGLLELDHRARLSDLRAPTLVLWATHDAAFPARDQEELRASLSIARERHGTPWWWKAYGREPLPETGLPGRELGHNFHWAAPEAVAADLAAFLRPGGAPTRDLCRADLARERGVVIEPGAAVVLPGERATAPAPGR